MDARIQAIHLPFLDPGDKAEQGEHACGHIEPDPEARQPESLGGELRLPCAWRAERDARVRGPLEVFEVGAQAWSRLLRELRLPEVDERLEVEPHGGGDALVLAVAVEVGHKRGAGRVEGVTPRLIDAGVRKGAARGGTEQLLDLGQ